MKTESTHELKDEHGRVVAGCWLKADEVWCDFKLFAACDWDEEDDAIAWAQIREDEVCDLLDCTEMTDADPVIDGHIKWDGCIEFEIQKDHYCDGAESVAELHRRFQWMLRCAHEAMGGKLDWEPLP